MMYRRIALFFCFLCVSMSSFAGETDCSKLFNAIEKGELETVRDLLKMGCDPNTTDKDGGVGLGFAKSVEIAKMLIKAGANINAQPEPSSPTALIFAVLHERPDLAKYFIEAGADVNKTMVFGLSPLLLAAGGNLELVKLLVENGANVNYQSEYYGESALMIAAQGKDSEIVKYLLQSKSTVDAISGGDQAGKTALMYAAQKNNVMNASILIDAGADVNINEQGNTALMHAAWKNSLGDLLPIIQTS